MRFAVIVTSLSLLVAGCAARQPQTETARPEGHVVGKGKEYRRAPVPYVRRTPVTPPRFATTQAVSAANFGKRSASVEP